MTSPILKIRSKTCQVLASRTGLSFFPEEAGGRGWREGRTVGRGWGPSSQKLSLQLKKQKHSRAEPPQPPAETKGKTLRQCVFLPSPRSVDCPPDLWGPPRSVEGGSGFEVPVKSPYIRLVEVNADTEARSWSLLWGWTRAPVFSPCRHEAARGV